MSPFFTLGFAQYPECSGPKELHFHACEPLLELGNPYDPFVLLHEKIIAILLINFFELLLFLRNINFH